MSTMKTEQIVLLAIVFIIVVLFSFGVMALFMPNSLNRRLKTLTDGAIPLSDTNDLDVQWAKKIAQVSEPIARLSIPKEGWENSALRTRFMHAGWRSASAPVLYFAAKTGLAVGLPLVCVLVAALYIEAGNNHGLIAILVVLSAIGYYLPNVVLSRRVRHRQQTIFEDFPDALDLLTVCVEAGLGLDAALMKVAEEMHIKSRTLSNELQLLLLELRAGQSKETALKNLALRTGVEDLDVLVAMLIQAERFGTSVGDSLRVHSENLRLKRRLRAEEAAAKIAVKLLFPLIFCIFPTLMLVLLGPAFIQVLRVLLPTFAGQTGVAAPPM
ncbi:MAG: type II secretion system F family protein [Paraburkholderia sp.]|uniref:type II secretion system F family protein n=1 Tax=Paraburkholderia sp. TaxID=1926495 RepID=UPI00121B84F4|nr:type II secretion system F family protein [Paraburkholderia sp.]TAM06962.1 MAG: type II secretion system F family protein [Paraburkholderia sp.]TAM31970.1 MAG: type II secretion system F family protein [Paraburkholderia sp.]